MDEDKVLQVIAQAGAVAGEEITIFDTRLAIVGEAANRAAEQNAFATYQERRAENTQSRHRDDLACFSTFLWVKKGIYRSAEDLYRSPEAWRGITHGLLSEFKNWMYYEQPEEKGFAPGSVRVRLSTVRKYCELAYESGMIPDAEMGLIRLVKNDTYSESINIDRKRTKQGITTRKVRAVATTDGQVCEVPYKKATPTPIKDGQASQLTTTTTDSHFRPRDEMLTERDELLICLFVEHALRVSEVVALDVASMDLAAGTMTIQRLKTYGEDILGLLPRTREAAERYLPLVASSEPLFRGYQDRRITRQGIFERVRLLGKLIGIENLSPHDLRHWWTRKAFLEGNGLDKIQQYGGWNSPAMPLHYAKLFGVKKTGLKLNV